MKGTRPSNGRSSIYQDARGTWHAWENPTGEPCVIAGLMVATGP